MKDLTPLLLRLLVLVWEASSHCESTISTDEIDSTAQHVDPLTRTTTTARHVMLCRCTMAKSPTCGRYPAAERAALALAILLFASGLTHAASVVYTFVVLCWSFGNAKLFSSALEPRNHVTRKGCLHATENTADLRTARTNQWDVLSILPENVARCPRWPVPACVSSPPTLLHTLVRSQSQQKAQRVFYLPQATTVRYPSHRSHLPSARRSSPSGRLRIPCG